MIKLYKTEETAHGIRYITPDSRITYSIKYPDKEGLFVVHFYEYDENNKYCDSHTVVFVVKKANNVLCTKVDSGGGDPIYIGWAGEWFRVEDFELRFYMNSGSLFSDNQLKDLPLAEFIKERCDCYNLYPAHAVFYPTNYLESLASPKSVHIEVKSKSN